MFEGAARSLGEGSSQFEDISGQTSADASDSGIRRKRVYKGKLPLREEPPLMPPGFPSIERTGNFLSPLTKVPPTKTEKKRDTPWKKSSYKGTLKMREASPLVKNHPRLPAGKKQEYSDEEFQKISAQLEAEPDTLVLDPVEEKYKGIIEDADLREILKLPKEFQGSEITRALKERKVVEARKASRVSRTSLSRKDFVPFRDQEEVERKVGEIHEAIKEHREKLEAEKHSRPIEKPVLPTKKQAQVAKSIEEEGEFLDLADLEEISKGEYEKIEQAQKRQNREKLEAGKHPRPIEQQILPTKKQAQVAKNVEEEGELLDAGDLKEISMKEYEKIEQAQKRQKERRSFLGSIKNLFRGFWS